MLDAWEWMFGQEQAPALIVEHTTDYEKEVDAKLWNDAWNHAKKNHFKIVSP